MLDYARFDAMLSVQLDALERRAEQPASFSGGLEGDDQAEGDEVWSLVQLAIDDRDEPEPGALVSFGDEPSEGRLARAWRECNEFVDGALRAVTSAALVESGQGQTRLRTRVRWDGDATSVVAASISAFEVDDHMRAVERALTTSLQRLRLVTAIVVAAGRVALMLATPAGGIKAMAIAYRCVKTVYEQWRASEPGASRGETPWQ